MENNWDTSDAAAPKMKCEPCDDCYNLVQEAADEHRKNLANLDKLLQQIAENPEPVGEDFEYQLMQLKVKVRKDRTKLCPKNQFMPTTTSDRLKLPLRMLGSLPRTKREAPFEIASENSE